MNIISIDLPWKEDKKGRRILAIADLDGNVKIAPASDDNEMLGLVRHNTEPESLVFLDIPIEGCENLGGEHYRPVDKALLHQGISILPTSKAENRGKGLKEKIQSQSINQGKRVIVQEIYPYAVYKFLAYLKKQKDKKLLQRLALDKFDTLLDNRFRVYWPPKYKREKKKDKRLENMNYLYSLLTDADIGLNFQIPLHRPDASNNFGQLSDEYDACLGAIVGIYFANNSSYACVAGDSDSGNMLLLADRWLSERLSGEVRVYRPEKRSKSYETGYRRAGNKG